jgi:tRNA threonylcarbamoyladenosine biosynthesis protein TsaE
MEKTIIINNSNEIIELGKRIGELAIPNMVITMEGDLGAGKTTMTKGIALGLDIKEIVNSPTFTIMKTYKGKLDLFHLDVYRINDPYSDFELEEYFESNGVCVIEWAQQIAPILPDDLVKIEILDLGDNKRQVTLSSDCLKYIDIIEEVTK